MATHSSTLAWEIPWMEEPGRLQSMGSLRVGQDWATSLSFFTFMHWRRKWQPSPVFLPRESQGREPGGLPSMGLHRVGHDWRDLAAAAAMDSCKLSRFSHVRLFVMLWTVACQAPLPLVFSRQEYWSGLPFPSPGDHLWAKAPSFPRQTKPYQSAGSEEDNGIHISASASTPELRPQWRKCPLKTGIKAKMYLASAKSPHKS